STSAECQALWTRVRAFASRWETDPALSDAVAQINLTFDLAHDGGLYPNLYFRFQPALQARETAEPLAADVLAMFYKEPLVGRLMESLTTCYAQLPPGAYVNWIGAMMARPSAPLKITVRAVPNEALGSYLEAVGYPGRREEIVQTTAHFAPLAEITALSIDANADGLCARLGVEYSFNWPRHLLATSWTGLLDACVQQGWCSPARRTALYEWSGYYYEPLEHMVEPQTLRKAISHIKVIHDNGLAPTVKAYLYLGHDAIKKPRPVPSTM
ncbi:MAG TPA: hypothetical protein VMT34_02585, partial [Aggregatilineales bacterium]|nr:hypothetical protein [Aggregatilineales bacterium]